MKFVITAIMALFVSIIAFADAPSRETALVTRVLLNNTEIVRDLQKEGISNLFDVMIVEVVPGINQYYLKFNRQCECMPATAEVTITEDLTPTYADGPIKYTSTIVIKKEGN